MEKRFGKVYRQSLEVGLAEVQSNSNARVFGSSKTMFAQMIAVDVLANLWMGFLLYGPKER
jgi:hypothetical protein